MKRRFRESTYVVRQRPIAEVGFLGLGDVPVVDDVGDFVTDTVSSVWDRIPGSNLIDDATRSLVEGPMRAFAKTGVGEFTLNVIAANAAQIGGMIPLIGPAIIISTAAIPGLLKGDDMAKSLIQGWAWRIQTAAQILTPMVAAKFGEWTGKAGEAITDAAKKAFPDVDAKEAVKQLADKGINTEKLSREAISGIKTKAAATMEDAEAWAEKKAKELGVPPASLLQAADLNSGSTWFNPSRWDLASGNRKPEVVAEARRKLEEARRLRLTMEVYAEPDVCQQYIKALQYGLTDVASGLKAPCDKFKTDRGRLMTLAATDPCRAYVEAAKGGYADWARMLKDKCALTKATRAAFVAEEHTSAKATNYVLLAAGIVLALGGTAWYLHKRGK